MNKLISFSFKTVIKKLLAGEHYDFFHRGIIDPLTALMASLPSLSGIFSLLSTTFTKEDELFKKSQASILTSDITTLHEKRLGLFAYLKHSIEIVRYSDVPAELQALQKLLFLLKTYSNISSATYSDQTGLMDNFIQDCLGSIYLPSIQLLGLLQQVNRVKDVNEEFGVLYTERSMEKAVQADKGNWREVRDNVDDVFNTLVEAININWTTNELGSKEPALRANLIQVKEIIVAAISQAELNLSRRGRHKKDGDKNDSGTQTPDQVNPTDPNNPTQKPNTEKPKAPDISDQNPSGGPHVLDPDEHPPAGE
ncbi:MAG: DUF6261 family protein [Tannerellaceae bacterium]|jgi:hypothetical protein|nr:DUF6261 family protein [Tannerellaceae bacterium]